MRKSNAFACTFLFTAMMVLILDSKTALFGAKLGMEICVRTVIPSLFPFFVVSIGITNLLSSSSISWSRPIAKKMGIPDGSEGIFLIGLLGGYPVGAKCVASAWERGQLTLNDGRRMLGFCSNAGPAFIFGMLGPLFHSPVVSWCLWGIHILSAIAVGFLIPKNKLCSIQAIQTKPFSIADIVKNSVAVMSNVCAWIILFRVILSFLEKWILWLLPKEIAAFLAGILELSNGSLTLGILTLPGERFVLASVFLGFGGLCVALQTISAVGKMGLGMYLPGKLLQALLSFVFAGITQKVLFVPKQQFVLQPMYWASISFFTIFLLIFLRKNKKTCSILTPSAV